MNNYRYRGVSISLDRTSHQRCKVLAHERTTSVSGLIRILINDTFRQRLQELQGDGQHNTSQ
jgi:hypothetical protein